MLSKDIWLKTLAIIAVEAGIIFSVVLVGLYVRFGESYSTVLFQQRGFLKVVLITFICQFIFYLFDLYDLSKPRLRRELINDLLLASIFVILVLGAIFALLPALYSGFFEAPGAGGTSPGRPTGVPIIPMILALAMMILGRFGMHWLMRHPRFGERILIVGTDSLAIEIAREALARRDLGFKVVGFVAEDAKLIGQSLINPKVVGVVGDLNKIVETENVNRVVVALQDRRGHLPVDQLLNIRLQGRAAVEEGTSLYERLTGKISTDMMRPSWIIFSGGSRRTKLWDLVRRIFNVVLAFAAIIITLPISIATALAIKLDSNGPIFYTQERVGKNGRIFKIVKFRSMRVDAEKDGTPQWAAKSDPRITRIGNLIRRTRIDEIPQFINILRGEMSFVGPRAERAFFVEQLSEKIPYYSQRHLVEPGLTGWAQVNYGYGSSLEDAILKFQYDLYYIKNASLIFDLWIMFKSIKIVIFGYGR